MHLEGNDRIERRELLRRGALPLDQRIGDCRGEKLSLMIDLGDRICVLSRKGVGLVGKNSHEK